MEEEGINESEGYDGKKKKRGLASMKRKGLNPMLQALTVEDRGH